MNIRTMSDAALREAHNEAMRIRSERIDQRVRDILADPDLLAEAIASHVSSDGDRLSPLLVRIAGCSLHELRDAAIELRAMLPSIALERARLYVPRVTIQDVLDDWSMDRADAENDREAQS